MPRKPNANAVLKTLPEEDQEDLWSRLNSEGGTYEAVAEWLAAERGIVVSATTVGNFFKWYALRLRYRRAEESEQEFRELVTAGEKDVDPEKVERFARYLFNVEAAKADSPDDFIALQRLELERRRVETAEAKVDLLRRKIQALEEKEARAAAAKKDLEEKKGQGGLSPEALELIERTLGMLS